jgi:hypothetical protein
MTNSTFVLQEKPEFVLNVGVSLRNWPLPEITGKATKAYFVLLPFTADKITYSTRRQYE